MLPKVLINYLPYAYSSPSLLSNINLIILQSRRIKLLKPVTNSLIVNLTALSAQNDNLRNKYGFLDFIVVYKVLDLYDALNEEESYSQITDSVFCLTDTIDENKIDNEVQVCHRMLGH